MYNDEQNLYHYTYRKDGTEPGQHYDAKQPTVDEQLNSYRQQQEQQHFPGKYRQHRRGGVPLHHHAQHQHRCGVAGGAETPAQAVVQGHAMLLQLHGHGTVEGGRGRQRDAHQHIQGRRHRHAPGGAPQPHGAQQQKSRQGHGQTAAGKASVPVRQRCQHRLHRQGHQQRQRRHRTDLAVAEATV